MIEGVKSTHENSIYCIIFSQIFVNYCFYNFTKCLTARDWALMDNDESLFLSYGQAIEKGRSEGTTNDTAKFFFCFSYTSGRTITMTLRTRIQQSALRDIVTKSARTFITTGVGSKRMDFFTLL